MSDREDHSKGSVSSRRTTDYLERYSGEKPPRTRLNNILDQDGLLLVGLIVTQWGHLSQQIDFLLGFWSRHPEVPKELRNPNKNTDFVRRVGHLRKVAPYYFEDGRPNSLEELERIFGRIMNVKTVRDDLAHGTYALKENEVSGQVTVHGKNGKRTFSHQELLNTAQEISECTGTLLEFDSWAHHAKHLELHKRLEQMINEREA